MSVFCAKLSERLQASLVLSDVLKLSLTNDPANELNSKFFAVPFTNSVLTIDDLKYILDQIESFGDRIDIPSGRYHSKQQRYNMMLF